MPSQEGDSSSEEKAANAKKICLGLQSQDRKVRRNAYIELENFLSNKNVEFSNQDLRHIFTETHMYILNGLRDKVETVREQAIRFIIFLIIDKLPLNDFYLTYVYPVLVERIGTVELIEESEEIRLQLLQLLDAIIAKYSNTEQLKPFLNDSVTILAETVKDKYPAIKELSCRTIRALAVGLPRDFHLQAETLIKPVLSCFTHQRYKVRVESIEAIGEIVMHSTYKGLDEVVGPLAERLFDQIPIVRRTVAQVAARWMLDYRDRYSFFYKILPLLLTGLNDEVAETRAETSELWEKVGLQYKQENEKDLKDEMDYLYEPPKYYPSGIRRPNLGCRELVKRNVSKVAPAISRELVSWQEDVRLRCGQLLCALVLHAEDGITQNLQALLTAMYSAARDDDSRVVANIVRASEIIGVFVRFETWSKLILPTIEDGPHYGHLMVLAGLIKGSPKEYISESVEEVSKLLAEDFICNSRMNKYQLEMMKCVQVISEKHDHGTDDTTGCNLFKIVVTLLALRHPDNEATVTPSLFEDIRTALQLGDVQELWVLYVGQLLRHINMNVKLWTTVTEQACIFWTILSHSEEAFGENLEIIGDILKELLDTETDAETRLKTFYVLATAFEKKEVTFRNAVNLTPFLERLIIDVFVPSLVWHAGANAEAIRAMGASCLRHALTPVPGVELFQSGADLRPLVNQLLPLLVSLLEDASHRSRLLAVECLLLLKGCCEARAAWGLDELVRVYPEILKRLDDPSEKVRLCALENIPALFTSAPKEFGKPHYRPHIELIIDTLLTHFDDDDENVQELVYGSLKTVARINKDEMEKKIERHRSLLRNQKGCEQIAEYLKDLSVS